MLRRIINKSCLHTMREVMMAAFAFMHCTIFEPEGEIVFSAHGADVARIRRIDVSNDFEEFYAQFKQCGAEGFYASCRAYAPNNILGLAPHERSFELISAKYREKAIKGEWGRNGVVAFFFDDNLVKEAYEKIYTETLEFVELLKKGKSIPPIHVKENEHPIKCYIKRPSNAHKMSVDINRVLTYGGEEVTCFRCQRNDFHFSCPQGICCCGQCEMLEKSYHMLVKYALKKSTRDKLTAMVEKAGLFHKGDDGTTEKCQHCKGYGFPNGLFKNVCSEEAVLATQAIRGLWYVCYHNDTM